MVTATMVVLVAWMLQAATATLLCWWYLHLLGRPQPLPATLPPVLVIVPVRGTRPDLAAFLSALAAQDHLGAWRVVFALEDSADPAFGPITRFVAEHSGRSGLVLAGPAVKRGQKVQNLLAALATAQPEESVVVTLDADTVPPPDLLRRLVRPILSGQAPIASGYRWSLPAGPGLGTLLVALADAGIATLPRCARCNLCWGGATAVQRGALDLAAVWDRAVSDDLALTGAARRMGRVIYAPLDVRPPAPGGFSGLAEAFAFGTRQYRVLRLHAPWAHALALATALLPVAGASAALATAPLTALTCVAAALVLQQVRAALRGRIAGQVLPSEAATLATRTLRRGAWLQPLVPVFQLACLLCATGGGRKLDWAGRRYTVARDGQVAGMQRLGGA